MPPSPLPWPRFSSLRTRFPAFVQCHSLEIGGGRGGKKPVSGRREGGPLLLRSLSIVREQPYVLDPDSDPGGPNPDEIFAKVKTRSGYFASRLFHHFSNVGWHRASTFTQGSFALLSSCILCSYSEQVTRTHTSPPPRILPLLPSPLPRGKRKVGSLNIGREKEGGGRGRRIVVGLKYDLACLRPDPSLTHPSLSLFVCVCKCSFSAAGILERAAAAHLLP